MTCEYIFSPSRNVVGVGVIQGSFRRPEPHLFNWWGAVADHIPPPPKDEDGTRMVWCSGGHWENRKNFTPGNTSHYCADCAKARTRYWRAQQAAAEGRELRDKPGRPPKLRLA